MNCSSFSQDKCLINRAWEEEVYPCPYNCSKQKNNVNCPIKCMQGYTQPKCLSCAKHINTIAYVAGTYSYNNYVYLLCRPCWLSIKQSLVKLNSIRKQTYRSEAQLSLLADLGNCK